MEEARQHSSLETEGKLNIRWKGVKPVSQIVRTGFLLGVVLLTYYFFIDDERMLSIIADALTFDFDRSINKVALSYFLLKVSIYAAIFIFILQLYRIASELFTYRYANGGSSFIFYPNNGKVIEKHKTLEGIEISESHQIETSSAVAVKRLDNEVEVFEKFRERMLSDARRLAGIGLRNLFFGIFFSGAALFFLGYPLLIADNVTSSSVILPFNEPGHVNTYSSAWDWVGRYYLPRMIVGLILQFVGFFFLRLYVANEVDIKHNKNEITNIESKMISFFMAQTSNNKSLCKAVIDNLAKTERNFIVKRSDKIIGQDLNIEYNDVKSIIEQFISRVPSIKNRKCNIENEGSIG